jgi:hypothetical protein
MLFVAAMHNRTPSRLDWMVSPLREVHEMMVEFDEGMRTASRAERRAAGRTSAGGGPTFSTDEVLKLVDDPIEHVVVPAIEAEFPLLMRFRAVVLCASESAGAFITSDHPVSFFDPCLSG